MFSLNKSLAYIGVCFLVALPIVANSDSFKQACLYATTVGNNGTPIAACPDSDPLNLAKNVDVLKAMNAFGIKTNLVRFKGCEKQIFAVYQDTSNASSKYVVTYATEQKANLLAAVIHELAHVMQMEAAGGLVQLTNELKQSKRIELGADYLVGVIFSKHFPTAQLKLFEQNLLVMGQYYEKNDMAHGTPEERTSAFRRGAFKKPETIDADLTKVSKEFQRNIYGQILEFSK